MANVIGTVEFNFNKLWISSSCVSKTAISSSNGRSASIFRISTDYSINPWSISLN
ncbi:hypothetical protein [Clostridium chromiireducens]|uniref:Uncharacterized protein n=1 Tax=Clostridium chromiireducens TaxID=225345 RepID=A0A1V4J229_9CLOT|nr:hypothetical protein [Clostridium chromiireducens]OPJ65757.1 hypothetical protein CLCHR_05340 [Clostridium chromiireducens]